MSHRGIPTALSHLAQHQAVKVRFLREATGWTIEHTEEVMAALVTLGVAEPRRLGEWSLHPTFRTQRGAMTLGALMVTLTPEPEPTPVAIPDTDSR